MQRKGTVMTCELGMLTLVQDNSNCNEGVWLVIAQDFFLEFAGFFPGLVKIWENEGNIRYLSGKIR